MAEMRIGKISSINESKGTARVLYPDKDNKVSSELPFLHFELYPYRVDDLVYVLTLDGSSSGGLILGMAYSDIEGVPETSRNLYRKELTRNTGTAFIRCDESGNITVFSSGSINITAPSGDVTVNGISLCNHTHTAPNGETGEAH